MHSFLFSSPTPIALRRRSRATTKSNECALLAFGADGYILCVPPPRHYVSALTLVMMSSVWLQLVLSSPLLGNSTGNRPNAWGIFGLDDELIEIQHSRTQFDKPCSIISSGNVIASTETWKTTPSEGCPLVSLTP